MKNHLYISLVSGLVGMTIGASSMFVVEAAIIRRGALRPAATIERPSARDLKADAKENEKYTKEKRANVVYPEKTLP